MAELGGGSGIAGPCTGPHPQRGMMRSHRPSPALLASALLFACTEATPPPQVGTARPPASVPAPAATAAPDGAPRRCALQGVVRAQGGAPVTGALVAAKWLAGRTGVYPFEAVMADVLGG